MSRFRVYLTATASRPVVVEADNLDDALAAADEVGVPSLCHHCASNFDLGDFFAEAENVEEVGEDE